MMVRKEHLTIKGLDLILKMRPLINKGLHNEKIKNLLNKSKDLFTEYVKVSVDLSDLEFKINTIPSPY